MKLSIVIPSISGEKALRNCLASLPQQASAAGLEVIVVTADDREVPGVVVVRAEKGASLCAMRAAGAGHAAASKIAFLGDRYRAAPGWTEAALEERGFDATAGAIAPSPAFSFLGWSIYLTEYAHVSPPVGEGATTDTKALPGGNVVYRRGVFERTEMARCETELEFHAELLTAGAKLGLNAGLEVQLAFEPRMREYLAERFHFSSSLARERAHGRGVSVLRAAFALLLPAVVPARVALAVLRKRRYRLRFLACAPVIFLFGVVQAAGELAVYAGLNKSK